MQRGWLPTTTLRTNLVLQPLHAMVPHRPYPMGATTQPQRTILGSSGQERCMLALARCLLRNRLRTNQGRRNDSNRSQDRMATDIWNRTHWIITSPVPHQRLRAPRTPRGCRHQDACTTTHFTRQRQWQLLKDSLPTRTFVRRSQHIPGQQGLSTLPHLHERKQEAAT